MNRSLTVHLQRCTTYNPEHMIHFFQSCYTFEKLGSLYGSKVIIKPNLISAKGGGLACTHPQFILALAEWLQQSGARVEVGDSPAFGKASGVLQALGVARELQRRDIKIIEFKGLMSKMLNCGVEVGVAREPLECDLLINAPKLKAHNQMYVTLAVKNLFGIIKGVRKGILHMRYGDKDNMFSKIILDLIELLPLHVSVVDGVEAMHREGPVSGSSIQLGCLAFSRDPVSIDTTLLHALELEPSKSPLWVEAARRGLPGSDLANIAYPMCMPEDFADSGFEVPAELAPEKFNPLRFIMGNTKRLWLKCIGR